MAYRPTDWGTCSAAGPGRVASLLSPAGLRDVVASGSATSFEASVGDGWFGADKGRLVWWGHLEQILPGRPARWKPRDKSAETRGTGRQRGRFGPIPDRDPSPFTGGKANQMDAIYQTATFFRDVPFCGPYWQHGSWCWPRA